MSNKNLDRTEAGKTEELNEADLESVAGGLVGIASRRAPIPDDGRSIAGVPVPNDGRSITAEPVPDDGKF